jgi:acylphosphatase
MSGSHTEEFNERRETRFAGKVQGVGFRYTARQIAERFRVTGFVKNTADGRVLLVTEGDSQEIDRFLAALRTEQQRYIQGEESSSGPATLDFIDFAIHY